MKQIRKICLVLILGCILTLIHVQPALAQKGGNESDYTYTVTLYAGKQGTLTSSAGIQVDNRSTGSSYQISAPQDNGDVIYITGLKYGDVVMMNGQKCATLGNSSKYYIGGVRESGHDNQTVSASAFRVESDRDYVIAYGIRGNMVAYTVNYLDEEGNELLESETYYGSVGDRPVVAFRYVENYWPKTYNLTKTLSANEAENVFTFVYTPMFIENEEDEEGEDESEEDALAAGAQGNEDGQGAGSEEDQDQSPADLVNLDEEEVPLASRIVEQVKEFAQENTLAFVGITAFAVAGLSALTWLLVKKHKKKKEEAEEEAEAESQE